MHYFRLALRGLLRRGNSNIIKILCLAAGLALGLLLIAKVCFERSYNDFIPDADRIYIIEETFDRGGEQGTSTYPRVSGGVLPAMRDELPQVETGTRMVLITYGYLISENNDTLSITGYGADSLLMSTLGLPMVLGNPSTALSQTMSVMISRSFADKLGGPEKAMGMPLHFDTADGQVLTVTGVFEDLPDNTHLDFDVLLSLEHMGEWSLNNWQGNDRYEAYIKVRPGTDIGELEEDMRAVQARHIDVDELVRNNDDTRYTLKPLLDIHVSDDDVKDSNQLMLLLGIMLIVISVLNYILIIISTLVGRSRATAIEKCYGAGTRQIVGRTLAEASLHMFLALAIAAVLVVVFRETVMRLLSVRLESMLAPATVGVLIGIVAALLIFSVVVSSMIYVNVPVAVAFRGVVSKKRWWKIGLLFVQFVFVSLLVTLMATMAKQYDHLFKADTGYAYENLAFSRISPKYEWQQTVISELKKLPAVDGVTLCFSVPWYGASGNNVSLPGSTEKLLNYADLYTVSDNFFDVLEIPVVEGSVFPSDQLNDRSMMVSRSFAEKICKEVGWDDGIIGKELRSTDHSHDINDAFTVIGVYEDFIIGNLHNAENRPSAIFYDHHCNTDYAPTWLLMKLNDMSQEVMSKIDQITYSGYPRTVHAIHERQYQEDKNVRDSIMICCLVALVIALAGLIGYAIDEINRRKREIAIRKVNGAETTDVVRIICRDVTLLSIPALAIGIAMGYMIGLHWLESFAMTWPLTIWEMLGIGVALWALIVGCVGLRAARAARVNPTESINANE